MGGRLRRPLVISLFTVLISTCIDPYAPELGNFESVLVVDALITDNNSSYEVHLTRTVNSQDMEPPVVSGAQVSITDGSGNIYDLPESSAGTYKSDSTQFRGEVGMAYKLHIKTPDGNEYESETCNMYPVAPVDTIYFAADQGFINNDTETADGIGIFIDTRTSDESRYYRWTSEEWWKIIVPDPKKYHFVNETTFVEIEKPNQVCWGNNRSEDILVHSTDYGQSHRITEKQIAFIPSGLSTRFLVRYYFEVNQYSLSPEEYLFWDHMRQINESGGDIFEKQPFPVFSNIFNINNPEENVLGYFQVSAIASKGIYINGEDISGLSIPLFSYFCERIELGPSDFPPALFPGDGMSFSRIYSVYNGPVYSFIEPLYNQNNKLVRYAFSRHICSDCTLSGSLEKPDFWTDQD